MPHNTAMRTILGARRWSSACIMQSEISLVSLINRVQQIAACRVAKVILRGGEGAAQSLRLSMAQDTESLSSNPWLLQITLVTRTFALPSNQPWRQADRPAHNYRPPAPWELPASVFSVT